MHKNRFNMFKRGAAAAEAAVAEAAAARRAAAEAAAARRAAAEAAAAETAAARRAVAQGAIRAARGAAGAAGAAVVKSPAAHAAAHGIGRIGLGFSSVASKINPALEVGTRLPPFGARGFRTYSGNNFRKNLATLREKTTIKIRNISNGKLSPDKANNVLVEINKLIELYPNNPYLEKLQRHLNKPFARAFRADNLDQLRLFRALENALESQTTNRHIFAYPPPVMKKILRSVYAFNTAQLREVCTNNNIAIGIGQHIEHCYEINRALRIDLYKGSPAKTMLEWIRKRLNSANNLLPIDEELHPFKTELLEYIRLHPGSNPTEVFDRLVSEAKKADLKTYFRQATQKIESLKVEFETHLLEHPGDIHLTDHIQKMKEDIELFTRIFNHVGGVIKIQFGGVDEEISNKIADFILDISEIEVNDIITINNDDKFDSVYNDYRIIITALHQIKQESEQIFDALDGGSRKKILKGKNSTIVNKIRKSSGRTHKVKKEH